MSLVSSNVGIKETPATDSITVSTVLDEVGALKEQLRDMRRSLLFARQYVQKACADGAYDGCCVSGDKVLDSIDAALSPRVVNTTTGTKGDKFEFLIYTLEGEPLLADLENIGACYRDDDVIYIFGIPCRLSSARHIIA